MNKFLREYEEFKKLHGEIVYDDDDIEKLLNHFKDNYDNFVTEKLSLYFIKFSYQIKDYIVINVSLSKKIDGFLDIKPYEYDSETIMNFDNTSSYIVMGTGCIYRIDRNFPTIQDMITILSDKKIVGYTSGKDGHSYYIETSKMTNFFKTKIKSKEFAEFWIPKIQKI
jgi:hypothetical protein